MFGKRCTLCGGKLDSNGICKECGLDNKKNDKNYRVNQSSCDGQPLTHVHTEETKPPVKERMQKASGNKAPGGRTQTGPSQSYRPPVYQPAPGSGQKRLRFKIGNASDSQIALHFRHVMVKLGYGNGEFQYCGSRG